MSNRDKITKIVLLTDKEHLEKFISIIDLCVEDEIMHKNRYREESNYHIREHEMTIQTLKQLKKRLNLSNAVVA